MTDNWRDAAMRRLTAQVADLTDRYDEGTSYGPGLLHQLEDVEHRTLQSVERTEGKAGKPGSRPPMPLDAVSLASKIKQGAMDWCFELHAEFVKDGYDSLRRLPSLAETATDDQLHTLSSDVGKWRSTCRTVLGYQEPAVDYPHAVCPYCGQRNVRARPQQVRAWCATEGCEDDDGKQPEFTRMGLMALIHEAS